MPLTAQPSNIPGLFEPVCNSRLGNREPLILRVASQFEKTPGGIGVEFVSKALLVPAGHQTGARRAAVRARYVAVGEAQPVTSNRIDVRRRDVLCSEASQVAVT